MPEALQIVLASKAAPRTVTHITVNFPQRAFLDTVIPVIRMPGCLASGLCDPPSSPAVSPSLFHCGKPRKQCLLPDDRTHIRRQKDCVTRALGSDVSSLISLLLKHCTAIEISLILDRILGLRKLQISM